ncbi:amidohydrolase family protein [Dehalogenimonas sp. THU2]|uniref:amidohydrolase family protein n=1 Tax=Dehalogenimonas sp. THU2 TaxID=3151121 RepID=UPI003218B21D
MIIDFHTHVFSPTLIARRREYADADPCFGMLYCDTKAKLRTADELIAEMDSSGVNKAVIQNIGWTSNERCVETNDYLLEAAQQYPERLIPFICVQPLAGDAAIEEIRRCAAAGARGVGELRPDVQGFDLADQAVMTPLVKTLMANNLVLSCHADEPVGHRYPGKGAVTPQVLLPFIERYPRLKLVLAHWGGGLPFYALMPEVKEALQNTWFDSAATPFLYRPDVYERAADLVGEYKILFGSDWPLLGQRRCLDELKTLSLSTHTLKAMLGGNAITLLGNIDD